MVELGGTDFWERLAKEPERLAAEVCLIDTANLDATLQRHASLHAWVNAAHEVARLQEERAKWDVTKARARALLDAKGVLDAQTGKGKTAPVLEAEVELNTAVQAATEAVFSSQEKRGALRAMADALEDRLQMLIQIAAKQRQEQGNYR